MPIFENQPIEYDPRPVYRMLLKSLNEAIKEKSWEKVKKVAKEIEAAEGAR